MPVEQHKTRLCWPHPSQRSILYKIFVREMLIRNLTALAQILFQIMLTFKVFITKRMIDQVTMSSRFPGMNGLNNDILFLYSYYVC